MYEKIENIIVRTLSPFEYEQLEELKSIYSEEQIINAYKNSPVKNINYIKKYIQSSKKVPTWLKQNVTNEQIDNETKLIFDDFNNFLEEFRNDTTNNNI